jgi:hypothetical protein
MTVTPSCNTDSSLGITLYGTQRLRTHPSSKALKSVSASGLAKWKAGASYIGDNHGTQVACDCNTDNLTNDASVLETAHLPAKGRVRYWQTIGISHYHRVVPRSSSACFVPREDDDCAQDLTVL